MLKKAALLVTALTLSACGAEKLPTADLTQTAGVKASTSMEAEEVETIGPDEAITADAAPAEEATVIGAPDTTSPLNTAETACPTINGSFVLTIGGEIRDRLTIQTRRENGKLAYSFNNGEFYETQNKVHRTEQGGLARVACDRDLVRLNYRDASGSRSGRLEVLSLGEGQVKVTNEEGSVAMSGMYVSAQ